MLARCTLATCSDRDHYGPIISEINQRIWNDDGQDNFLMVQVHSLQEMFHTLRHVAGYNKRNRVMLYYEKDEMEDC